MKIILTESQEKRLVWIRRMPIIWDWVEKTPDYKNPCEIYNFQSLEYILKWNLKHTLGFDSEMMDEFWQMFMELYGEKLREHYKVNCTDRWKK